MPSRKPLKAPVMEAFLDGAPIKPADAPAPKPKRAPKPKAAKPTPIAKAPDQTELTLTDVEIEPTKLVSLKIPLKMFEDIDTLRRASRITLTDILVKSAAPQIARLMDELKKRGLRK